MHNLVYLVPESYLEQPAYMTFAVNSGTHTLNYDFLS